jgi:hypothetical protein
MQEPTPTPIAPLQPQLPTDFLAQSPHEEARTNAELGKLLRAVEIAWNNPWRTMWRGFLYGFMTTFGAWVGTILIIIVSALIVSRSGLAQSLLEESKTYITDIQNSVLEQQLDKVRQTLPQGETGLENSVESLFPSTPSPSATPKITR